MPESKNEAQPSRSSQTCNIATKIEGDYNEVTRNGDKHWHIEDISGGLLPRLEYRSDYWP
ncbi:hypothetical protein D9M68_688180 [compost metagenome]